MPQRSPRTTVGTKGTAVVFDLFRTRVCPELADPTAYRRVGRVADVLGLIPPTRTPGR